MLRSFSVNNAIDPIKLKPCSMKQTNARKTVSNQTNKNIIFQPSAPNPTNLDHCAARATSRPRVGRLTSHRFHCINCFPDPKPVQSSCAALLRYERAPRGCGHLRLIEPVGDQLARTHHLLNILALTTNKSPPRSRPRINPGLSPGHQAACRRISPLHPLSSEAPPIRVNSSSFAGRPDTPPGTGLTDDQPP